MISEDKTNDLRRVTLTQDDVVVSVLPELGAKIETLRLRQSRRNVLLAPPERPLRAAHYGAAFEDYDTSGFDECFPTVAASPAPDAHEILLPDHGELWSVVWTCERDGDALLMETRGRSLPYLFRRRLSVRGSVLRLDYKLVSESDKAMRVLWSAHPLLAASPDSRIILPTEVKSLLVNSSTEERLGKHGEWCAWSLAKERDGSARKLDRLPPPQAATADKLFTDKLKEGWCAFHDRASDERTTFRFDVERTPYVGLWICAGGFPEDARRKKHYTVALEPCSGRPDKLAEAAQRNECVRLAAGASERWWLEIELGRGEPGES